MAKKRTGLQSDISGIFSGVPVPKKGGQRSKPGSPGQKSDDPPSKTGGPVMPKPVAPKPVTQKPVDPVKPAPQRKVESVPAASQPKVADVKVSGQKIRQVPRKISRRGKDKLFASKAGVSSTRQKTSVILFVFLSTVLVIVLARPYLMFPGNPDISPPGGDPDIDNSTMADIEIEWPMPTVYSADMRDPMELVTQQETLDNTPYGLEVIGIVVSEDLKQAIIGTDHVLEGEIVPGTKIRVKKINLNSVEFEEDGKTWIQKTRERQEVEGVRK
jgi:hypothetical protein